MSPLWIKYDCREKYGSSCILTVTFITFNSQHTVRGTSHWLTRGCQPAQPSLYYKFLFLYFLYFIFIFLVLYFYISCTLFLHFLYFIFTFLALYFYISCTLFLHFLYFIFTFLVLYFYISCNLFYNSCTLFLHFLYFIFTFLVLYFATYTLMYLNIFICLLTVFYLQNLIFLNMLISLSQPDILKQNLHFPLAFFLGKLAIYFCLLWMILLKYSSSSLSHFNAPCRLTMTVIIDVPYSQNAVSTGVIA